MTAQPGGRRSIGLRDWFGDAQRRIARLGTSGPILKRRAIHRSAAPLGIALLQRGVRAGRRAALATTVRAPETRLTLRHPLRPGRIAEPRFTVQSAPAASLAVRAAAPDQAPAPPAPPADEPGGGPRVEAQAPPQPSAPPASDAASTPIATVGRAVRTLLSRVRGAPPPPQAPAPQPPTPQPPTPQALAAEPPVDGDEPSAGGVAPVLRDERPGPTAEDEDERPAPAAAQPSPRDAGEAPDRAGDGPPQSDLVLRAPAPTRAEAPPAAQEPPTPPATPTPAPRDERPVEEPARAAPPPPAVPGQPPSADPASEALDEPPAAATTSTPSEFDGGDQREPIPAAPPGPPPAEHDAPAADPAPAPPTPRSRIPAALALVARVVGRLVPREPERSKPTPPDDAREADALTETPAPQPPARPEAPVEPPAPRHEAPAEVPGAPPVAATRSASVPAALSLVARVVRGIRPAAPPIESESRATDEAPLEALNEAVTPPLDERVGEDDRTAAAATQSSIEPPLASAPPPVPSELPSDARPGAADGTQAVDAPAPAHVQRSPIARVLRRLAAGPPEAQAEPRPAPRDAPQPLDHVDAEAAPAGRPDASEAAAPRIERPLSARPGPVAMIARAARRFFAATSSPDAAPPQAAPERPSDEEPGQAPAAAPPAPAQALEAPDAPEGPLAPSPPSPPSPPTRLPLIARLAAAIRPRSVTAQPEPRVDAPPPAAADRDSGSGVPAVPLVARRPAAPRATATPGSGTSVAGVPAPPRVAPAIRVYRRPAVPREAASSGSSEATIGSLSARDALALLPGAPDETIDDEKAFAVSRSVRGPVAVARTAAVRGGSAASAPAEGAAVAEESTPARQPDLERLARQVYSRLRDRLLIEGERAGRGYRWF